VQLLSKTITLISLTAIFLGTLSCGGGGTSTGGGGGTPPPVPQTTVVALAGNAPTWGLAGSATLVEVKVLDSSNSPVANSVVTFSTSTPGVELYPSQATTTGFGIARTVVHLPIKVHSAFSVTAKANTGGSYTASVSTGMQLVRTYGTPNAGGGVVSSDGAFFGGPTFTDISSVFNPDGSLRQSLAPSYAVGKYPMSGQVPILTPDGKLYYWEENMILPVDSAFNPLSPIDIYGRGGYAGTVVPAVDSNGRIYTTHCAGYSAHDSAGKVTADYATFFDTIGKQYIGACHMLVNSSNNPVIYGRLDTDDVFIVEYDQTGKPIHYAHLPARFGNDPSVIAEPNGRYLVHYSDQLAELDSTFQVAQNLFSPDPAWGLLAGIDSGGRYYFQSVTPGTGGPNPGAYWVCDHTGLLLYSEGEPDFSVGTHLKNNQSHIYNPHAATSDSTGRTVYIADGRGIVVYQDTTYVTTWLNAGGYSIAFAPSNEIYATSNQGATVFDLSGNVVRTLVYPQIQSGILMVDIAVDQVGNKFIYDPGHSTIHQIGPDDSYVRAINLPAGTYQNNARGIALTPDGNLIVTAFDPGNGTGVLVMKISRDGSLIWSVSAAPKVYGGFPRVDSSGRIYVGSIVLDSSGKKLSDVGFAMNVVVPVGNHVVMLSDRTIYELSAD